MKRSSFNLWIATTSTALGAGFLIYSTYVTNNLQVVGESWLNETYTHVYGIQPTAATVSMLWASVIASKEVGKIIGTFLIPYMAERFGRRGGLLLNSWIVFAGCIICLFGRNWSYQFIMLGRILLGRLFFKRIATLLTTYFRHQYDLRFRTG
jgi:MFS family permease